MNTPSPTWRRKQLSKWPALVRVMLSRLALLGCLLVALATLTPWDAQAFYAFIGLAFVINVPYALWLRTDETARRSAPLQFLADSVIITGLVHFTGGLSSELCLLYPLVILSAGIVSSGNLALRITVLCIFLYATVVVLELHGILPFRGSGPTPYEDPAAVVQSLMLRLLVFSFFSAPSHYLATRCAYQASQLQDYQQLVQTIFDRVPVGLIALRQDGTVAVANPPAARMLHVLESELTDRPARELFDGGYDPGESGTDGSRIQHMRRPDGSTFPVSLAVADTRLPDASVPRQASEHGRAVAGRVLAIRDMTDSLKAEEAIREATELRTTFRVAGEIAHSVRNPLTAVRAAAETLVRMLREDERVRKVLSLEDIETLDSLNAVILAETDRVGDQMERFLDHAVEAPTDVELERFYSLDLATLLGNGEAGEKQNSGS